MQDSTEILKEITKYYTNHYKYKDNQIETVYVKVLLKDAVMLKVNEANLEKPLMTKEQKKIIKLQVLMTNKLGIFEFFFQTKNGY